MRIEFSHRLRGVALTLEGDCSEDDTMLAEVAAALFRETREGGKGLRTLLERLIDAPCVECGHESDALDACDRGK